MKNVIEYKGYIAEVEYDSDSDRLFASVVNMEKQGVHADGKTPQELKKNLKAAIEAHLRFCKEWGETPDMPFSGRITYRTTPQHHAELAKAAIASGKRSINAFIDEAVALHQARILEQRP